MTRARQDMNREPDPFGSKGSKSSKGSKGPDGPDGPEGPESAPDSETEVGTETQTAPRMERACKVILYNDEEHTYDYVVEMLTHACRLDREKAFRCAVEVDLTGRTIVFYGSRTACVGVVSRIHAYGPDHRLPQSMSSMRAEVQGC
jgi:ATP-dependent Clp protease adaptor protein ClpS